MIEKVCAITGANGLVGSICTKFLRGRGFRVRKLVRKPHGEDEVFFELAADYDPEMLAGVDVLIHCAYDFGPSKRDEIYQINVQGSSALLQMAQRVGVEKVVNISSVGAFDGCKSTYGQAKIEVEQVAKDIGGVSIRPGLVFGDPGRGMFGALNKMTDLPLLPVFSGGRQPMVLVHVEDLVQLIYKIIEHDVTGAPAYVVAAHEKEVLFRDILQRIAARKGKTIQFLSVPGSLALWGLRCTEALGIPMPFRSDSLVGLLDPARQINFSTAKMWEVEFRKFE